MIFRSPFVGLVYGFPISRKKIRSIKDLKAKKLAAGDTLDKVICS
jgi:hypothetical protein